jgi:hypothetical protein
MFRRNTIPPSSVKCVGLETGPVIFRRKGQSVRGHAVA